MYVFYIAISPSWVIFELMKRAIDGADVCKTITCGRHQDVSLFKEDPIQTSTHRERDTTGQNALLKRIL